MPLIKLLTYAAYDAVMPESKVKKNELKFRISLFFDGTLNNRENIAEREKAEMNVETDNEKEQAKSYTNNGKGDANSYDNGRTNIAIMEPCVRKKQNGYKEFIKVYVEGQGSTKFKSDDLQGYAGGSGDSGVVNRAAIGVQEALQKLEKILDKKYPPEENKIVKIDIDVFGFSRGAATARHAISLIMEWFGVDNGEDINTPVYKKVRYMGYREMEAKTVEVKFAGVYDTVVSVNGSQINYWSDKIRNQRAVALATKSLHLAAAEEHRLDFPLHTIKSALNKGKGEQYYLPGVHSDVGGSYNQANDLANVGDTVRIVLASGSHDDMLAEQIKRSPDYPPGALVIDVIEKGRRRVAGSLASAEVALKSKLVELRKINDDQDKNMRSSSEKKSINVDFVNILELDKKRLIDQGWYKPHEIKIESFAGVGRLVVNRKNIKSAYSNIPLKIMADYAVKNGLTIETKLKAKADLILKKHSDLLELEKSITKYISKVGASNSKPDDWLENAHNNHESSQYPIGNIRHDHLHMSCQSNDHVLYKAGYTPRFSFPSLKRRRYYYEG